jgi:BMFP domain-containing protein YqiC
MPDNTQAQQADGGGRGLQTQHPVMIFGLGGTGKQVLLNFRRMYYERYGETHPPYMGHLWVDTDSRTTLLDGQEMDFLMKEVDFEASEKVEVGLQAAKIKTVYDQPNNYPHIFSWFDKELTRLGIPTDGAAGIRSFGRLAFFQNYERIMDSSRQLYSKISDINTYRETLINQGINVDNSQPEAWLIFSVAGGTGNGMFLDFAFALRNQWPNILIRSIILLPSVFSNDKTDRCYANAYSALMELEHYTYGNNFPIAWTQSMYQQGGTRQGPVFDNIFLIDNAPASSAGQISLEDKNALCRMIAEWLYIEHSGGDDVNGLVSVFRQAYSNASTARNDVFRHSYPTAGVAFEEEFSRRYSSFGLSKLYIPIDRVTSAVQYRLAKDFLTFWTAKRPIPANLDELLANDYLQQAGINNTKSKRDFLRALETGGTGNRLTQNLEKLIWKQRRDFINRAMSPKVSQNILDWLKTEILQNQLDRSDVVKDRWGSISKSIAQNSEEHYNKVIKQLDALITRLLSEPRQRFEVAREVLRRMRDSLNADAEHFQKIEDRNRTASNNAAKQVQQFLQWLDDVKGKFTRKTLIEVAFEALERQVKRELQAQIAGEAAALATKIADYIGKGVTDKDARGDEIIVETGLIKQVIDYQNNLKQRILARLNERIHAVNKIEHSPIYRDMSQGEQEIDLFYLDSAGRPIGEETLTEWERVFFETQGGKGPSDLWDMRNTLELGEDEMIKRILAFARESLAHLRERTPDILERLTQTHQPGSTQYSAVIDHLLNYSSPWLPKGNHLIGNALTGEKLESFVALSERTTHSAAFKTQVRQKTQNYQFVSTTPDRVYAASTVGGFPLMVIKELDRYRKDSYLPHLENGVVLHTDLAFEKFPDLLIKEENEVKSYIETLKIFLKATLLGIITANQDDNPGFQMKFSYLDNSAILPKTRDLGPFSVAVALLSRITEQSLLDSIKSSVVDAITDMDVPTLREWCALLFFHAGDSEGQAYYSSLFPANHVVRAILEQEANSLIQQNGERMKTEVKTAMQNLIGDAARQQDSWAVEKPEGSKLYILESWRSN